MDSQKLNRWLTLGANIGVLTGIILLVVELDQNRDMKRAEIRSELAGEIVGLLNDTAYSSDFASIFVRSRAGEELTPAEAFQYRMRAYAFFRYFENVHYQYRQGLYDESEYSSQKIAWAGFVNSERTADLWCGYRSSISADARTEIDRLVTIRQC